MTSKHGNCDIPVKQLIIQALWKIFALYRTVEHILKPLLEKIATLQEELGALQLLLTSEKEDINELRNSYNNRIKQEGIIHLLLFT